MRELTVHSGYLEHYLAHSKCYRSVSYQVHSCKRCTLFFVHVYLDDVISSYIYLILLLVSLSMFYL